MEVIAVDKIIYAQLYSPSKSYAWQWNEAQPEERRSLFGFFERVVREAKPAGWIKHGDYRDVFTTAEVLKKDSTVFYNTSERRATDTIWNKARIHIYSLGECSKNIYFDTEESAKEYLADLGLRFPSITIK